MIGCKTSYNDRYYVPSDVPANIGYTAAEEHFSAARLNPDIMMVESDHDMHHPTDMIVLDRIAKSLFRIPGYRRGPEHHQAAGTPLIAHSSIPYQISMSGTHHPEPAVPAPAGRRHRQDVRMT